MQSATPPPGAARVRAFSESAPVVDVAASGEVLWVATTRGLLRWDLHPGGSFERIGRQSGIPADHATAIAIDPRGGVWVATENGIARQEKDHGKWQMWSVPEVGDRVTVLATASTPAALWAGGPAGAARMVKPGKWDVLLKKSTVTSLLPDREGDGAWIGTHEGIARCVSMMSAVLGPADGNEVREVRGIVHAEEGGVLWAGMTGTTPMLGFHDGKRVFSYRIAAAGDIRFLRRVGGQVLLAIGEQVYSIKRIPEDLLPTGKLKIDVTNPPHGDNAPRAPRWEGKPIDLALPADLTGVFATPTDLWMGTRALGTMRWNGKGETRYATYDLTDGADRLTVACASADECYVATGGTRAWWFDGRGFQETEVDGEAGARVLAAVRDPRGNVIAIDRGAKGRALRLYGVNQGVWSPVGMQDIEVPEGQPELTFASYAPTGHLWLGLQYHDRDGEPHFFGAAEVDVASAKVQYHRQYPRGTSPPAGTLPIPNDCTAVFFGGDGIWFATKSGAVRVDGTSSKVRLWTENEGLESELLRDVQGGASASEVWVATDRGIGHFDGKNWHFTREGPLHWRARSLARTQDGTLWVATDHGALEVHKDGSPGLLFDRHAGLLDDDARDIGVDMVGRLWVLGTHGLAVIDPPKTP
jgi:hypothetical protein